MAAEWVKGVEAEGDMVGCKAGHGTVGLAVGLAAASLVAGHALAGWEV